MRFRNITVLSIALLMVSTLTACSSAEPVEKDKDYEVTVVEETETEEVAVKEVEVKEEEVKETEPAPEPTLEPTPEPTPEAVTYEGIDMESTLPGEEWIKTFDGIITEPKVVVLSDETGKKQIVEDGDEVIFNPDTDYMAVYLPGDAELGTRRKGIRLDHGVLGEGYNLLYLDAQITRERGRQNAALYVTFNGKEVELPFKFIPE